MNAQEAKFVGELASMMANHPHIEVEGGLLIKDSAGNVSALITAANGFVDVETGDSDAKTT